MSEVLKGRKVNIPESFYRTRYPTGLDAVD